jgi:hypothetical protein
MKPELLLGTTTQLLFCPLTTDHQPAQVPIETASDMGSSCCSSTSRSALANPGLIVGKEEDPFHTSSNLPQSTKALVHS